MNHDSWARRAWRSDHVRHEAEWLVPLECAFILLLGEVHGPSAANPNRPDLVAITDTSTPCPNETQAVEDAESDGGAIFKWTATGPLRRRRSTQDRPPTFSGTGRAQPATACSG